MTFKGGVPTYRQQQLVNNRPPIREGARTLCGGRPHHCAASPNAPPTRCSAALLPSVARARRVGLLRAVVQRVDVPGPKLRRLWRR